MFERFALRMLAALGLTLAALPASAAFHLWTINEIYSNADGTVQFIELTALSGGQEFTSGHPLIASSGGVTHTYNVTSDLPGDSAGHRFLFGTAGFAALNLVQPDYVIPNNFIFPGGGTINWADADIWTHGALPTDGELSLNRSGVTGSNSPTNFAGMQGHIQPATTHSASWTVNEIFSNADGTVQFIELSAPGSDQQFTGGRTLVASSGGVTHTYVVTSDLPGDSAGHRFLVGTTGFAALNVVQPDFVIPNNFIFPGGGTINWASGVDVWNHGAVPTDGEQSLNRSGVTGANSPTNFANVTGHIQPATTPTAVPSFQGLWWKSPPPPDADSESGWGVNLAHQGNFIFATWFTYDLNGDGMWLAVLLERSGVTGATFAGTNLYRTTAAPFNAEPWDNALFRSINVGNASMTFTDVNNGTFTYTVNGITQTKAITRQIFAAGAPACFFTGGLGNPPNYSDLWWRFPEGQESGWGVNITHQGTVIFATWFTYGMDGNGLWLAVVATPTGTPGQFRGLNLYRTRAAPFNAMPWDSELFTSIPVGSATFTFTDASNGTFAYTVNGVTQTKPIMREVFASPVSVCR